MLKRVLLPYRDARKLPAYEAAVRAAGLDPHSVPASGKVSLDGFAGLVLLGGSDVNPKLYGQSPQSETDAPDDERDTVELELIDQAVRRDLPILAICRGLQILNVYHGGTLIQHLASRRHDPETDDPSIAAHQISIGADSALARIAQTQSWHVNSRHHQAVDKIGAGLRLSAMDTEDGAIEALERPDRTFVIAVQWHPEDQVPKDPEQRKLFQSFAEACH